MSKKYAIAIHGGAGTLSRQNMTEPILREHEEALSHALNVGTAILAQGGKSIDAVQAAVVVLEDCALFNAGRGSVLNRDGGHEMDAAIMDGSGLRAGAVAGIRSVRNPIALARVVLDQGDYVLLCGEKAIALAREQGLRLEEDEYFHTAMRYEEWQRAQLAKKTSAVSRFGTVGAVALDQHGHLAAATSTGGLCNKAYGRIGDSCIIGAGTYAEDGVCAVSCTGDGEAFIRAVAAYDIACQIKHLRLGLAEACDRVLKERVAWFGGEGGLIAIDIDGSISMPFTSEGLYRACLHPDGRIEIGIF